MDTHITHTAKGFIGALLDPDPTRRLTASEALAHPWLTRSAPPTEHDLSGLRENFDPRARWKHAIGAARALTRLGLAQRIQSPSKTEISDVDEDEDEARSTHLEVPSPPSESRRARSFSSSSSLSLEPSQPPAAADPKTPPVVQTTDTQEVEVERRMPGSFNYEAGGGDVGSPIDVVGILGGLWRRFRLGT